jgi:F-type H+-transporting ATPase subunit b
MLRFLIPGACCVMLATLCATAGAQHEDSHGEAAAEHGAAAADHAHHGHIGEKGVNRQPEEFRSDLAIFTLCVFALLFLGLRQLAWPKITAALEAREEGIRKAIHDAETARQRAEALMKEHQGRMEAIEEDVKGIMAEARRDAERTKQDIIAAANSEADAARQRAVTEIGRAKDQALDELFATMASRVTTAAEHVLGHGLTHPDRDRLIDESLAQFSRRN